MLKHAMFNPFKLYVQSNQFEISRERNQKRNGKEKLNFFLMSIYSALICSFALKFSGISETEFGGCIQFRALLHDRTAVYLPSRCLVWSDVCSKAVL